MSALEPGSVVGKYRIERKLGEGGMGAVYAAEHVRLQQRVAIKVLHEAHEAARVRFEREARAASRVQSPHVACVYDIESMPDGAPYIVMEYLDGLPLDRWVDIHDASVGEVLRLVAQLCRGLHAAHALGVVHRDVKPENVFVLASAPPCVKIVDFGIAKILEESPAHTTVNSSIMGTPQYMSPEQLRGKHVDEKADVFSVGVMLHILLAGRPPFDEKGPSYLMQVLEGQARHLSELRSDLPAELTDAVWSCLAAHAADRPAADALAATLERFGSLAGPRRGGTVITTVTEANEPTVRDRDDATAVLPPVSSGSSSSRPRLRTPWLVAAALAPIVAGSFALGVAGKRRDVGTELTPQPQSLVAVPTAVRPDALPQPATATPARSATSPASSTRMSDRARAPASTPTAARTSAPSPATAPSAVRVDVRAHVLISDEPDLARRANHSITQRLNHRVVRKARLRQLHETRARRERKCAWLPMVGLHHDLFALETNEHVDPRCPLHEAKCDARLEHARRKDRAVIVGVLRERGLGSARTKRRPQIVGMPHDRVVDNLLRTLAFRRRVERSGFDAVRFDTLGRCDDVATGGAEHVEWIARLPRLLTDP